MLITTKKSNYLINLLINNTNSQFKILKSHNLKFLKMSEFKKQMIRNLVLLEVLLLNKLIQVLGKNQEYLTLSIQMKN